MIGWYHTGTKLRASDQEINDLFKRFIARPVMVIVDVRPDTVGIPTDAYFAVEEIKDVRIDFTKIPKPLFNNSFRTVPKPAKPSCTSPPPSKPKRQKRSASSTSCGTSKTRPPQRSRQFLLSSRNINFSIQFYSKLIRQCHLDAQCNLKPYSWNNWFNKLSFIKKFFFKYYLLTKLILLCYYHVISNSIFNWNHNYYIRVIYMYEEP